MTSPKLLLALMATVSVQAAPQINEREVVGEVIQSLGPAIQQALASLGSSSSSSSSSSGCSLTVNIFLVHQIIQIGKFRLTYPADSVPLSVFRYGQCGLRLLLWEFLECMLSFVQSEESCTDGSASRE